MTSQGFLYLSLKANGIHNPTRRSVKHSWCGTLVVLIVLNIAIESIFLFSHDIVTFRPTFVSHRADSNLLTDCNCSLIRFLFLTAKRTFMQIFVLYLLFCCYTSTCTVQNTWVFWINAPKEKQLFWTRLMDWTLWQQGWNKDMVILDTQ